MDTRAEQLLGPAFAALLRRHREAAQLTQEELAEHAGLSVRGLRYLEQGVRQPYRDTVRRLADALALTAEERGTLEAVGRAGVPSTLSRPLHNLPVQPTPFLGRDREVALVRQRLLHPEVRLVTLTGPGGVGKTRLALRVASGVVEEFPDGVFVVFLAALADPALVASAVAGALGIRDAGSRTLVDTLGAFLRDKQMLLVLDNFEHVLAAAPLVATLLETSPGLKVLVTSRALLRLSGEHTLPVPPLDLPAPASAEPPERLTRYEAVRLFVERVQAVRPDFALTPANATAVVEICRRLEGLPLALELAAARLRLLSPQALLERLGSRLALLTGGARDRPPHQQTLRATLAWSYDLLEPREQHVFRRLSVFAAGCTPRAAEVVCAAEDGGTQGEVLDGLTSLADKSLLRAKEQPDSPAETGGPRFVLLETVREYGLEQLAASGEHEAVRHAHALYYLALVEEAESQLEGTRQGPWLTRLEQELDNVRAALGWAAEHEGPGVAGRIEVGLRLAAALRMFWFRRGLMHEGRGWLERLLDLAERAGGRAGTAGLRARALVAASHLAWGQSDLEGVQSLAQRGLALAQEAGDRRTSARALYYLAVEAHQRRAHRRAVALLEESQALAREAGDSRTSMMTLIVLGRVARAQGDLGRAVALLHAAIAAAQQQGDPWGTVSARLVLAYVARARGTYERATALAEEALALTPPLGAKDLQGFALNVLGTLALEQGDCDRAVRRAEESLDLFDNMGLPAGRALALTLLGDVARGQGQSTEALECYAEALALLRQGRAAGVVVERLEGLAAAVADHEQAEQAAILLGAAARLSVGMLPWVDEASYTVILATARHALGLEVPAGEDAPPTAAVPVWVEGQARLLAQAIAGALKAAGNDLTEGDAVLGDPAGALPCADDAEQGRRPRPEGRRATATAPIRVARAPRAERQAWALERLRTVGPLTPQAYAEALAVSTDTARRDLQTLERLGLVEAAGTTRDRRYRLVGAAVGPGRHPMTR